MHSIATKTPKHKEIRRNPLCNLEPLCISGIKIAITQEV